MQEFVTQYASWRPLEKFVIVFSHEGIEGETVKKLLVLASSFTNKEFFFVHLAEDKEDSGEEASEEHTIAEVKEEVVSLAFTQTEVSIMR